MSGFCWQYGFRLCADVTRLYAAAVGVQLKNGGRTADGRGRRMRAAYPPKYTYAHVWTGLPPVQNFHTFMSQQLLFLNMALLCQLSYVSLI